MILNGLFAIGAITVLVAATVAAPEVTVPAVAAGAGEDLLSWEFLNTSVENLTSGSSLVGVGG